MDAIATVERAKLGAEVVEARGKLQVVVSDEGFEAGRLNMVSIVIANPFNTAIEVLDIQAPQSSYLGRVWETHRAASEDQPSGKVRRERGQGIVVSNGGGAQPQSHGSNGFFGIVARYLEDVLTSMVGIQGIILGAARIGGVEVEFTQRRPDFILNVEEGAELKLEHDLREFDTVRINVNQNAKVELKDPSSHSANENAEEDAKRVFAIEPHCEAVAYIPLLTRGWLFFKPLRMNLTYLVRYRLAGDHRVFTQVITSSLDVRPPLRAVVTGAIFGAVLGTGAKFAQQITTSGNNVYEVLVSHSSVEVVQMVAAIIMSIIAAVALSRKSGAQNFITVEDFFGGFVIGVLIGYQGSTYFDGIISHLGTPNTPPR